VVFAQWLTVKPWTSMTRLTSPYPYAT
jgi:hypothetical protein